MIEISVTEIANVKPTNRYIAQETVAEHFGGRSRKGVRALMRRGVLPVETDANGVERILREPFLRTFPQRQVSSLGPAAGYAGDAQP